MAFVIANRLGAEGTRVICDSLICNYPALKVLHLDCDEYTINELRSDEICFDG